MALDKPEIPRFADVESVDDQSGQVNVVKPSDSKLDVGFALYERVTRQHLNWLHRQTGACLQFLLDRHEEATLTIFEQDDTRVNRSGSAVTVALIAGFDASNEVETTVAAAIPAGLRPRGGASTLVTGELSDGSFAVGELEVNPDGDVRVALRSPNGSLATPASGAKIAPCSITYVR